MLKVTAKRQDLEKALQVASVGVSPGAKDLGGHFVLRLWKGGVQVLTNNQRVCASTSLECQYEGEEGDAFTVIAKPLQDWLRGVGAETEVALHREGVEAVAEWSGRKAHFVCLEPSAFAYWDETLSKCQSVGSIDAERLLGVLDYVKKFTFNKETSRPDISQIEVLKGSVWATDKQAVSIVTVPELESSRLRVNEKDIPVLQRFLSLKETEKVEVLEGETMSFFRRDDDSIFGVAKPERGFPDFPIQTDGSDDTEWEIKAEDLTPAIYCLSAIAMEGDDLIRFRLDDTKTKVICSVRSEAGKERGLEDVYTIDTLKCSGAEKLPKGGFEIRHSYLTTMMAHFGNETLSFGITGKPERKGGYVRFFHEVGDDRYLTVVVWRIV